MNAVAQSSFAGVRVQQRVARPRAAARAAVTVVAAERPMWFPGAVAPSYLDGSLAGDRGFDPMGLGKDPASMAWYRQAELQNGRWAMLGVAGILAQSIAKPSVFWYNSGAELANDPAFGPINLGSTLAIEFILFHWVEVRRWQDMKNPGSVNEDPIFKGNKVPNLKTGYPGGIFDPLGFAKGNTMEAETKEIKNGRLAMVAFVGFVFAAQTTGAGPLEALSAHLASPFTNNWTTNIGTCALPDSVQVSGITIPTPCLWPGK